MTELEQSILRALDELETIIKSRPAGGPMPNLMPLFTRLDDLTSRLPKTADPELLHFLHKKSYEKARLLLQGRGQENARGTCG
jgi:hypothetical protein